MPLSYSNHMNQIKKHDTIKTKNLFDNLNKRNREDTDIDFNNINDSPKFKKQKLYSGNSHNEMTRISFYSSIIVCKNGGICIAVDSKGNIYGWGYKLCVEGYGEENQDKIIKLPTKTSIKCISYHNENTILCSTNNGDAFYINIVDFIRKGTIINKNDVDVNIHDNVKNNDDTKNIANTSFDYIKYISFTGNNFKVKIKQVSSGIGFSIFVTENGDIYSQGKNNCGCLGLNNDNILYEACKPAKIESLSNIEFVSCGNDRVICKGYDECYAWGSNKSSSLALGIKLGSREFARTNIIEPRICKSLSEDGITKDLISIDLNNEKASVLLTSKGEVFLYGLSLVPRALHIKDNRLSPLKIKNIPKIIRISCGKQHCMFIDEDLNLWTCGSNSYYQCSNTRKNETIYNEAYNYNSKAIKNITDISSGGYTTFVKTSNNKIYAFGKNENGEIPSPKYHSYSTIIRPIEIFDQHQIKW